MTNISKNLLDEIKRHEGYRSHAYRDSVGVWTIAYGLNLDDGIPEPLAAKILEWIVGERLTDLKRALPFWNDLSPARQDVFLNMAYNLGMPRFMKFKNTLAAAAAGDIAGVCQGMRHSKWYDDVGDRADRLIEKYRIG